MSSIRTIRKAIVRLSAKDGITGSRAKAYEFARLWSRAQHPKATGKAWTTIMDRIRARFGLKAKEA